MQIPALSRFNTNANQLRGYFVRFRIYLNNVLFVDDTINGKSTVPFFRAHRLSLEGQVFPVVVKVERVTADSGSVNIQNDTFWASYSEIINQKFTYADTAYYAVSIDAKQFGGNLPDRSYKIDGIKIKIPVNYNPVTRQYTGIWDGTFKVDFSNNPAWVFYDLLTNNRYGLGNEIEEADIDKFGLYVIAQYCDGLVPDGRGGREPRFLFDGYIRNRDSAYNVLQFIASNFMAMSYYSNSLISVAQDSPQDPVKLVTAANVIDGKFAYQSSGLSDRHSIAVITFIDPENGYETSKEVVEDPELIRKIGDKRLELFAYGCTRRSQANRLGKWMLDSEKNNTQIVSYSASLDHIDAFPGQIISIQDQQFAGVRFGGRVKSVVTTTVVIDSAIEIEAGKLYEISVILDNGAVETRKVTNAAGSTDTITIDSAFSSAVSANMIFTISRNDLVPTQWRIINVVERDKNIFTVTAVEHDPTKYARVENNINISRPPRSELERFEQQGPKNISVVHNIVARDSVVLNQLSYGWDNLLAAIEYEFQFRVDDDPFSEWAKTSSASTEIVGEDGLYTFRVRGINIFQQRSLSTEFEFYADKSNAEIENVSGLRASRAAETILFSWNHIESPILKRYQARRGNDLATTDDWDSATPVDEPSLNSLALSSARGGRFLVRAESIAGRLSNNSNIIRVFALDPNIVVTRDERPLFWPGPKVNAFVDGNNDLVFSSSLIGTYETDTIDVSKILDAGVEVELEHLDAPENYTWGTLDNPWPEYSSANGWTWSGRAGSADYLVEVSTSDDNITFTPYSRLIPGQYRFRYLAVRVTCTPKDAQFTPKLIQMRTIIDVPTIVEDFKSFLVPTNGTTLNFTKNFTVIKSVLISIQNGEDRDSYALTNLTLTSVDIETFRQNTSVEREVDVQIKGF
jgi:hypothetical protein